MRFLWANEAYAGLGRFARLAYSSYKNHSTRFIHLQAILCYVVKYFVHEFAPGHALGPVQYAQQGLGVFGHIPGLRQCAPARPAAVMTGRVFKHWGS